MIDHIGISMSDAGASKAFYDQALAPLGISVLMSFGPDEQTGGRTYLGYGKDGKPFFWLADDAQEGKAHVAFAAGSREEVEAFHAAAVAAGGRDNGAPGLRPHYHPGYYGAFVFDPDGHNIEAVFHGG